MFKLLRKRKNAQVSLEYTVLIIVILGAFVTAGNYFKRGIQGRWKAAVDDLGDQYDPRVANTHLEHTILSNQSTSIWTMDVADGGHWTSRRDAANTIERKIGTVGVGAY